MAEETAVAQFVCPSCSATNPLSIDGSPLICGSCAQQFPFGSFQAKGAQAMDTQAAILSEYSRAVTTRTMAAYGASVVFALISAGLIIFAPEHRSVAANLVAGAFLVLAVGIAGFTRFKAKAPGVEIGAEGRSPH